MSKKDEIITGLIEARKNIMDAATALPDKNRDQVFLGVWSVHDLLAHLQGWDVANKQSVKEIRSGKTPGVFKHWNPDWATYNAQLVAEYKNPNWDN